ncbi:MULTISPECIES: 3-dehydroquinate synthase II [unclassified Streptomyces]|uniref:3-dehydroquinate synthase II n=1 Tax=unclassified Streptomyces TaxID=2593676 RepID=UPI002DDC8EBC|nr:MULTISPECIES: 3-dehydroquinate synthase II [unclassified Streptomyces]WSA91210.1 3-dehydroquinate synthase II [Streptomyces sp. NBC_01795]WSB75535.1 3-dehydroquinate synthase II [Streptomyces sp. NBC_01775]WSS16181.1 3-dehydroquinate synthase II [Streptomyces sp. NBC_01186]WSS45000.1 3-dehydroquinate synthase II [Streptomyces sp. NBC_01187]
MKLSWLDIRGLGELKEAVLQEALHYRMEGIVADDAADLAGLPPTLSKILFPAGTTLPEDFGEATVVIVDPVRHGITPAELAVRHPEVEFGRFVEIVDAPTLEEACDAARTESWSVLLFRDPTKIPLEIVIAAAARSTGSLVTIAQDVEEAEIIFGVLEHGSDGVMMAPARVGDAAKLKAAAQSEVPDLNLTELEVVKTEHIGMGERACVDTCTHFREDEGILVGSTSKGMVLCVSETHPLPYMPTRPFRVNAGAIHSYTLSKDERTNYLSELQAGSKVMAVDIKGGTRMVTVGRVKIESRPLISVDAVAPGGQRVNLILQDDWHVRVLGPGGSVLNSTELKPGDRVLGYLPSEDRHVGYPIDEFCIEK